GPVRVLDGAFPADPRLAPGELEHAEHVEEPGAFGDPPSEPRPLHPGKPGEDAAGQLARTRRDQLVRAQEPLWHHVVDRRADRLVDGAWPGEVYRGQVA